MKFLIVLASLVGLASAASFSNPIRQDGPDPFMVWDKTTGSYYLLTTTNNDLEVTAANTIAGFANGDRRKVYQNATMAAGTDNTVWAPELHKINGKWYIYYSHGYRSYVIPGGANPFDAYTGTPVQLYNQWGIDGSVITINKVNYYVWSCLRPYQGKDVQSICIASMASPTSLDYASIGVLSQPDQAWEEIGPFPVNEGPQALYQGGKTWLTYSASYCGTASYSLGLLQYTSGNPTNPASWVKHTQGPVFQQGNGEYGTGHNGIFTSPDGTEVWNAYHAVTNNQGSCGTDRATFIQKVTFPNGQPSFGTPAGFNSKTLVGPSGE